MPVASDVVLVSLMGNCPKAGLQDFTVAILFIFYWTMSHTMNVIMSFTRPNMMNVII